MVEEFHKTCNVKHEIDIKRYGNVKSETDSCQSFRFGLSFRILSLFFPDYPITNRTLTTVVIYANLKQALTISRIWNQISLF